MNRTVLPPSCSFVLNGLFVASKCLEVIMTTCNFKLLSGALWFAHFFRMTVREGGGLDKVVGSGRASR